MSNDAFIAQHRHSMDVRISRDAPTCINGGAIPSDKRSRAHAAAILAPTGELTPITGAGALSLAYRATHAPALKSP